MLALILFVILSIIAVGCSVCIFVTKHPLYAAIALVTTMLSLAGIYGLLGSPFVGAVQVMVYFKDIDKVTVRRGASVETDCLFCHKGKLTLDVGAKCEAKMEIEVDELSVDASTSVISLEGKATRQTVFVAGTLGESSYDAHQLESEDVSIKAINTDAIVKFSNSLNAESIACTIRYIGDDSKVKKSGTGDVHAY